MSARWCLGGVVVVRHAIEFRVIHEQVCVTDIEGEFRRVAVGGTEAQPDTFFVRDTRAAQAGTCLLYTSPSPRDKF